MYLNPFIPDDSSINKGFEEIENITKSLGKIKSISNMIDLPNKILTFFLKLVLGIAIGTIVVPIAYIYLVHALRKSAKILKYARTKIITMRVSQLEKLRKDLNDMDKNMDKTILDGITDSPILMKPLMYALKESLDQYFELKECIDRQIEEDLQLFSEGLKTEFIIETEFSTDQKHQELLTCSTM